jgi:hypothetical protein
LPMNPNDKDSNEQDLQAAECNREHHGQLVD